MGYKNFIMFNGIFPIFHFNFRECQCRKIAVVWFNNKCFFKIFTCRFMIIFYLQNRSNIKKCDRILRIKFCGFNKIFVSFIQISYSNIRGSQIIVKLRMIRFKCKCFFKIFKAFLKFLHCHIGCTDNII